MVLVRRRAKWEPVKSEVPVSPVTTLVLGSRTLGVVGNLVAFLT